LDAKETKHFSKTHIAAIQYKMKRAVVKSEPTHIESSSNIKYPKDEVSSNHAALNDDDDDDDDDEIVREIEVYLMPSLSDKLYVLQYPLYHEAPPIPEAVRIKPKHTKIEMDHTLPTNIGTEGSFFLANRTLSSQVITIETHMAVGRLVHDGTVLQLVPLQRIVQMRPTFTHVDDSDPQSSISVETDDSQRKSREPKQVLFQRKESERAELIRKSSFAYLKASEEREEWIDLTVRNSMSSEYRSTLAQFTSVGKTGKILPTWSPERDFVRSLDYLPSRPEEEQESHSSWNRDDGENLASPYMAIVKRLTQLLSRGVPVPFSVLRAEFPTCVDSFDLLQSLASCAVLVRGNFYLHSKLLHGWDRTKMEARQFCLFLLQIYGHVQRRGLIHVYGEESSSWMEGILLQIAIRDKFGWLPRIADNVTFALEFAEAMQLHNQYWERQGRKWDSKLQAYLEDIE
jgi:DNA-directed RNA polymerase III subunit RPC5